MGHGLWRCLECSTVVAPDERAPNAEGVECPSCDEPVKWGRIGRVF